MSADDLVGREIGGRYRIEERLGEGGMGVVYRARHSLLDSDVAFKVIHPELAGTAEIRERFLREARTAMAVTHPNIVTVRDVGREGDLLYLAMDLVSGPNLAEVMEREGALSIERAAAIGGQILAALEEAHAQGLVHRDLKPSNIMLEGNRARVIDFGLAKWIAREDEGRPVGKALTQTGAMVGTMAYMAPEQLTGDPVDARTDLYATALILYEMLSGRAAQAADSGATRARKVLFEDPAPLDGAVGEVVMRGLRKAPGERPQDAVEFRRLARGRAREDGGAAAHAADGAPARAGGGTGGSWRRRGALGGTGDEGRGAAPCLSGVSASAAGLPTPG